MPTPYELNSDHTTSALYTKALDEVRRLCLGPSQPGGRRWTMRVPVQADDSDVLIAGTLVRLHAELEEAQATAYSLSTQLECATRDRDHLTARVAELSQERDRHRSILRDVNSALCEAKPGVSIGMNDFAEVIRELASKLAYATTRLATRPDDAAPVANSG